MRACNAGASPLPRGKCKELPGGFPPLTGAARSGSSSCPGLVRACAAGASSLPRCMCHLPPRGTMSVVASFGASSFLASGVSCRPDLVTARGLRPKTHRIDKQIIQGTHDFLKPQGGRGVNTHGFLTPLGGRRVTTRTTPRIKNFENLCWARGRRKRRTRLK